jgi:hypothetical protein
MGYSPAEAMRTTGWRSGLWYYPDKLKREHPVWAEQMERVAKEREEQERREREQSKHEESHRNVFPQVAIKELAAD